MSTLPTTLGWLVLAFPLAGTVLIALGYRGLPGRSAGWLGTLMVFLSFLASVGALVALERHGASHRQFTSSLWNYAVTAGLDVRMGILIDPLAVFMMLVVSGVSTLIHLYSVGYMASDRGYVRFFSYLNFFVFSMLLLVEAGNLVLLIVGWAFVGAASYMLISFWYRRVTATRAGIKAFVINVVGDVGLILGTYFLFRHTHSVDYVRVFTSAPHVFAGHSGALTAGMVLLLIGAFAKSAQVPLHTWLPDAMEGPTPVSALIHAATMVTAGVYLIARMHPLFALTPAAATVGEVVGAVTLLMAATIALAQTDLKRVIAYSTMSQIGYMIMGVSAGAYAGGLFHLMTHAFFKALLFMAAGSIIAAMANEQSLDRMGGFRRAMPFTFASFVVGGLALSALPPFSGFFSKDDILTYIGDLGGWHWALYGVGYLGALLTAVYTFRMIFRAFYGEPVREAVELEQGHIHHAETPFNPATGEEEDTDVGFPGPEHHIAERSWPMKAPMAILAVLAFGAGFVQIPRVTSVVTDFLAPSFSGAPGYAAEAPVWLTVLGLALSAGLSIAGIAIAFAIWRMRPGVATALRERLHALYELLWHKWYWDELIDAVAVRPAAWFGRFAQQTFERVFVDGVMVGGSTGVVRASSAAVRAAQSGFLRYYIGLLAVGVFAVALYFLIVAG